MQSNINENEIIMQRLTFNRINLKEALYDVIRMADFRAKRHFGPKPPDYVINKLTIHRELELFCKRVKISKTFDNMVYLPFT